MRVLHVTPAYVPAYEFGGPVRSVARLLGAMVEMGHEVGVIASNARGNKNLPCIVPGRRKVDGVSVHYLRAFGPGQYFLSLALLGVVQRAVDEADIVHIQGVWSFSTLVVSRVCAARQIPFIISPRGALDDWSMRRGASKKKVYWRLFERGNVQRADRVHVTTKKEGREVQRRCADARLVIVPNPLGLGVSAAQRPRAGSREVLLGMVGRLHPVKGFDVILPALARSRRRDLRLVLIGPDEDGYRATVERMAEWEGVRELLQFRGMLEGDALHEAYSEIDLLLLPSHHENFGNVVAEAATQGTPAWVSDQVGIMDWVRAENTGEVLPLTVEAWADALARLDVETLRTRYQPERLRAAVERHFAPRAVAKQMIAVYEEVLEEHRNRRGRA